MRAASMCSGIGAPEQALPDWNWVWSAEIEPFPSRILTARFPHSVNLGDMTAPDFCERARALGGLDVIIAGTPCQDFSIAGLRAGLKGERGNIMLRALQIYEDQCHAARLAGRPEPIFWWENVPGAPCHPLAAGAHPPAIAFDCKASGQNGFGVGSIASTMRSMGHAGSHQNGGGHLAVAVSHAVRRLLPVECERLQGFPDFHTDIPNGDRPAADGPRYKALGNSMAVPVIRWIGERIEAQLSCSARALS